MTPRKVVIVFEYYGFPILCEACAFHFFAIGWIPWRINGSGMAHKVCVACFGIVRREQATVNLRDKVVMKRR
jgi:hypothetical protein